MAAIDSDFDAPLGVGAIVSESFSILFRNLIPVGILGFVPTLLGLLVSGLVNGWGFVLGTADPTVTGSVNWASIVLDNLVTVVVYGLTTALLVQLAYDAKLGRPIELRRYIGPALASAIPIAILTFFAGILMGIGFIALIVPGLWIYAVLSMIAPSIVIERIGFRGFSRSVALTRGYRWPILGAIVLIGICTMLFSAAVFFIVGVIGGIAGGSVVITVVLMAVASAFAYGLGGISLSLIYARLREIKEGVSVDEIASVFD